MIKGRATFVAGAGVVAVSLALAGVAGPAHALSTKECSAKYKAAKDGGTLGGKSWNDFRKAECGADDKPAAAAKTSDKPAVPKVVAGNAVFPTKVAAKFASEKPFKQRLHTCSEQFQANKATGGNGGLRWVQKGGGYWSQCNARLKR